MNNPEISLEALATFVLAQIKGKDIGDVVAQYKASYTDIGSNLEALVLSGAYLGAIQAMVELRNTEESLPRMLAGLVHRIDEGIDALPDRTTVELLTSLRKPMAEYLEKKRQHVVGSYYSRAAQSYGVEESDLREVAANEDEQLRLGVTMMANSAPAFLGWSIAHREGTLSGMRCSCDTCLGNVWRASSKSATEANLAAIKDFGSTDRAYRAFYQFVVHWLGRLRESYDMNAPMEAHEVDPEKANEAAQQLLKRLVGGDK